MDLSALKDKPRPVFDGVTPGELSQRFQESKEQIAEEIAPKRRGRPAGSKNAPKGDAPPVAEISVAPVLKGAIIEGSKTVAANTGYPGWEIDVPSAEMISIQIEVVLKQYAPQISGPHAAIISLVFTLGIVLGPRAMGYSAFRAEKMKNVTPEPVVGNA